MIFRALRTRRTAQAGAVGVVALLAGLMPGSGVASDTRVIDADIGYTCAFGSGARQVAVNVSAEFPTSSPVGTAVRPEQVRLGLTLPHAALTELPADGTAQVSGSARLATAVTQNGTPTDVMWQQLAVEEVSAAPDEDVVIEAAGEVPTVTPRSAGDMVFTAGALDLDLVLRSGDTTAPDPVVVSLSCTVDPDQQPELGTVRVPAPIGEAPDPLATPGGPGPAVRERAAAPVDPSVAGAGDYDPPVPADCTLIYGPVETPARGAHGYMAGYSNVNKQKAAMVFKDPGHLRLQLNSATAAYMCPEGKSLTWLKSEATLDYDGKPQMPPATSTFLTFGFMPTTATLELELTEPARIDTLAEGPDPVTRRRPETTTSTQEMNLRLYDVKVNGTPLDVGPACRTVRPVKLVLTGKGSTGRNPATEGYTVKTGGALTGFADIPAFSGCGATEDLDDVFTAAVSGKGNFTKMMQGALCVDEVPLNCPEPPRPLPER
ncbi:DUF6801 domain-containing protein [Streptomyces brevispora]|uniref:DUF6801 domain-containing protein n=1 Tax=Streptomyces brevispora TaxID=887462 RepID=A0ABZ1FYB1_9ACTN|nr:DUF6801 domain-containing protein [Streptomyces brevispora]WSC12136.1 hypothetical protein OIE64_04270 [Streptomyces brevispora]